MEVGQFDLNLLRTLDALLTDRNVTRAAERVSISQPAMSGALKRLRQNFNDDLLVRIGHGFELTPLAQSLADPVRELLLKIQQTLNIQPEFNPENAIRTFRVASSDYVGAVILKPLARQFALKYPGLSLSIEMLGYTTTDMMMSGEIDLCITVDRWLDARAGGDASQLVRRKLFTDQYVCVVDHDNQAIGGSLSVEQFEHSPQVAVKLSVIAGHLFEEDWRGAGIMPHIAMTVPSFTGALHMVWGTPLLGIVPRRLANVYVADGKVRILDCPFALNPLDEFMIWHTRLAKDPANVFLRQALDDLVAALPSD